MLSQDLLPVLVELKSPSAMLSVELWSVACMTGTLMLVLSLYPWLFYLRRGTGRKPPTERSLSNMFLCALLWPLTADPSPCSHVICTGRLSNTTGSSPRPISERKADRDKSHALQAGSQEHTLSLWSCLSEDNHLIHLTLKGIKLSKGSGDLHVCFENYHMHLLFSFCSNLPLWEDRVKKQRGWDSKATGWGTRAIAQW